jgi:SAM-dependent methyltransferase
MKLQIRSPLYDKERINIPDELADLSRPVNGTVCSAAGDEYPIKNNIIDLITKEKKRSLAQSTNDWTLTASLYEDLWRVRSLSLLTGESFPIERERDLLIQWLNPAPNKVYLDIGCSTALYARLLKKAEHESIQVAIDFSKAMLQEARLKSEADETDIYLMRADAREMPFFSKTFDGLAMGGTLNELSDPEKVLYECRRVMKDEGSFFMMHLVTAESWYGRVLQSSAEWGGINFWSVDESNQLFEKAGFTVQKQEVKGIVCFTLLTAST